MEELEEKLRTIGEVSKISGVPVKTIRYYADIGLLPPAEVLESRYRMYAAEEIWYLGLIRTLRHLDFSIEEIRKIISGRLSVSDAIALQLDALDTQVRHLQRVQTILRQAEKGAEDPERSLEYLHGIGEALSVEAEDRNRFLAERLRAAIVSENAPEEWREREGCLRGISLQLPEELSPDQAAAWIELLELVKDPDFVTGMQDQVAPFWETVRGQDANPDRWQEQMENISNRTLAAIERGEGPESPAVQEIVEDWVVLFAGLAGEKSNLEFVRRLAAVVPTWLEDKSNQKLQELLRHLNPKGELPPYEKVNRLMLEGLRWKVAQEPQSGV